MARGDKILRIHPNSLDRFVKLCEIYSKQDSLVSAKDRRAFAGLVSILESGAYELDPDGLYRVYVPNLTASQQGRMAEWASESYPKFPQDYLGGGEPEPIMPEVFDSLMASDIPESKRLD